MSKLRLLAAAVAVSLSGLSFIASHEGTKNAAYPDPVYGWTVPTICTGHTATAKKGMWLSDAQCLVLLRKDADEAAGHVLRLSAPVPLTQGELDAYTSLTFNIGQGNFAGSTLLKKLKAGDHRGACAEILRWTHAKGKVLAGLVTRRSDENQLCLRDL